MKRLHLLNLNARSSLAGLLLILSQTLFSGNYYSNLAPIFSVRIQKIYRELPQPQELKVLNTKSEEIVYRLKIPKIQLDSEIKILSLDPDGKMLVPDDGESVSLYKFGALPGQKGSAVIAGHSDTAKGPAVFYNLKNLKIGDTINVEESNGQTVSYKINNIEIVDIEEYPIQKIHNQTDNYSLNLVTCYGSYVDKLKTYDKRLIIYSTLLHS